MKKTSANEEENHQKNPGMSGNQLGKRKSLTGFQTGDSTFSLNILFGNHGLYVKLKVVK